MALLEEQFTETLNAGAPDITYEGSEGREQQIAQALWDRLPPQARMQFGSFQQFFSRGAWKKVLEMLQQQMQGQEDQQEVQDPRLQQEGQAVQDQGIGGLMPQAPGMAYGGIAGPDGRMQYGIGSWFQEKIMDPIKGAVKSPLGKIAGAAALGYGLNKIPGLPTTGWWDKAKTGLSGILGTNNPLSKDGTIGSGLGGLLSNPNFLIPAAGLVAGTFAKPDDPGYTGQGTGLNIRDVGRIANITDPKTAMASGLRFSPDLETRKFTPEEMLQSYAATDAKDFSTPGAAQGGRIGYRYGKTYKDKTDREKFGTALRERDIIGLGPYFDLPHEELWGLLKGVRQAQSSRKQGRSRKQEGGLMDLGGMEKDYRNDGGFVPIGGEEKADDVPARLSRNEFVFTADAVRNAGGGDMDAGAEVMENVMKNLEGGGRISDESQGKGAGEMFEVSERLSEVV